MLSVGKQYPSLITSLQMWSHLLHPFRMSLTYTSPHRSRPGVGGGGLKHKKKKKKPLGVKWLFFGKSKILALSLLTGMPARGLSRLSLQRVSSGAFWDMDGLPGKCWLKGRHVLLHLYLERAEELY